MELGRETLCGASGAGRGQKIQGLHWRDAGWQAHAAWQQATCLVFVGWVCHTGLARMPDLHLARGHMHTELLTYAHSTYTYIHRATHIRSILLPCPRPRDQRAWALPAAHLAFAWQRREAEHTTTQLSSRSQQPTQQSTRFEWYIMTGRMKPFGRLHAGAPHI